MKRITIFSIGLVLIAFTTPSKLTAQNHVLSWVNTIGSSSEDGGACITVDADGNVYTIGTFSGAVDFDPDPDNEFILSAIGSGRNLFVTKHSGADGSLEFAVQVESASSVWAGEVAVSNDGFIYVTGAYHGEANFSPNGNPHIQVSNGNFDVFVLKLNQEGEFLWVNSYGGVLYDYITSVDVDNSGNVIITGSFNSPVDFNPDSEGHVLTPVPEGSKNCFILKLNGEGEFLWVAGLLGGYCQSYSLVVDYGGNSYIVGEFFNSVDFNPSSEEFILSGLGTSSAFILKLDSLGNFVWVKDFDGYSNNAAASVAVNEIGEVLIGGYVSPGTDLDPSDGELVYDYNNNRNVFLIKLSSDGDLIWSKPIFGQDYSRVTAVAFGSDGAMYGVGLFNGELDFNPGFNGGLAEASPAQGFAFFVAFYSNGDFMSVGTFGGGSGTIWAYGISVGPEDEVLLTGEFSTTCDFDPTEGNYYNTAVGLSDIFILRLMNSPTSVFETGQEDINVFPNPATDRVVITSNSFNNSSEVSVMIYNLSGQIVFNQQFIPSELIEFDPGLQPGFYLLKIFEKGGPQHTTKLVVE